MQKDWQTYAEHLLAEHTDDEDRCEWARDMTALSSNRVKSIKQEPEKIRGKPADRIPPARKPPEFPTKIPDYIKKQIGE